MKKILGTAVLSLALTSVAFADGHTSTRDAEHIYKECGIGGMLFGKSSPIGAVISNVTWDLGTTALSSNVSSADTCVKSEMHAAAFINNSYNPIMANAAIGKGEYLEALSRISGKDTHAIRSQIQALVSVADYASQTQMQKSMNLYNAIM